MNTGCCCELLDVVVSNANISQHHPMNVFKPGFPDDPRHNRYLTGVFMQTTLGRRSSQENVSIKNCLGRKRSNGQELGRTRFKSPGHRGGPQNAANAGDKCFRMSGCDLTQTDRSSCRSPLRSKGDQALKAPNKPDPTMMDVQCWSVMLTVFARALRRMILRGEG